VGRLKKDISGSVLHNTTSACFKLENDVTWHVKTESIGNQLKTESTESVARKDRIHWVQNHMEIDKSEFKT